MARRSHSPPDLPLAQTRLVGLSDTGRRVGDGHPRATIPDEVVRQIRDLHELDGLSYAAIAQQLALNIRTVEAIGSYRRRILTPQAWKRIPRDTRSHDEEAPHRRQR